MGKKGKTTKSPKLRHELERRAQQDVRIRRGKSKMYDTLKEAMEDRER